MKRTLTLALAAALSTAILAPLAAAQDNFPDVPENHWSYEALEVLKREGILLGYPDGLYRGARNATRYEVATAIYQAYRRLKGLSDGLSEQISEIQKAIGSDGSGDLKELRDQLAALKAKVDGMGGSSEAMDAMKKLTAEFEKELASLGVDVEAMKKDLADLEERVTKLEGNTVKGTISISGDANIFVAAGNSRDGRLGLTKDGRVVGADGVGAPVGMTRDLNVFHEVGLNIASDGKKGPKWFATLVFGNMLGDGQPGSAAFAPNNRYGGNRIDEIESSFVIDKFVVDVDGGLANLPFSAKVGRLGVKVAPYIFQRPDTTPYFYNERWDDGEHRMDGAVVDFNFGNVGLSVLGGRNDNRFADNGTDIGIPGVEASLGAVLSFNLGQNISGKAAYLFHDLAGTGIPANQPNRLNVYGGEATAKFGAFTVNGGYSKSILTHNTDSLGLDNNNQAAFANVGYAGNNWGLTAEYRKIQNDFAAQGSWRRLGTAWSPKNLETFTGMGFVNFGAIKLEGHGEFGETISTAGAVPKDADIESYMGKLSYQLNDAWKTYVSYEEFKLKNPAAAGNLVRQRWATVGLGTKLGETGMLNLAYEYGAVQNNIAWGTGPAGSFSGGFLTTQLSIKF